MSYVVLFCVLCLVALAILKLTMGVKGTWGGIIVQPPKRKREPKPPSKGELEVKQFMENYFGKSFVKVRPDFLQNHVVSGKNLELDCYNDELKLAVEFNGKQHYMFVPFFHKRKEVYHNQRYRDELKRSKCRDVGIKLIEVPWNVHIANYLTDELEKNGYQKNRVQDVNVGPT